MTSFRTQLLVSGAALALMLTAGAALAEPVPYTAACNPCGVQTQTSPV